MTRHFEAGLSQLKEQLVTMAGLVEREIELAMEALQARETGKLREVHEIEKKVNEAHMAVDETCVRLLALQQPLAADLRLIVAVIKINADLERMGDQAVNIAQNGERYLQAAPLRNVDDVPLMGRLVRTMVREAIDAFVRADVSLAREVLLRDDRVDDLKDKVFRDVTELVKPAPELLGQGLCQILIARNLERIGDHATNIAEDVIYAISGKDVRHSSQSHKEDV